MSSLLPRGCSRGKEKIGAGLVVFRNSKRVNSSTISPGPVVLIQGFEASWHGIFSMFSLFYALKSSSSATRELGSLAPGHLSIKKQFRDKAVAEVPTILGEDMRF